MKAFASKTIVPQTISHDLESRVNQAVDAFMKGVDQLLAEEHFPASPPVDFSRSFHSIEWIRPKGYILN